MVRNSKINIGNDQQLGKVVGLKFCIRPVDQLAHFLFNQVRRDWVKDDTNPLACLVSRFNTVALNL